MDYFRLLRIIQDNIKSLNINLAGYTVYTEVGTGAYVSTPVIAALAGAKKVYALAQKSKHGSIDNAFSQLDSLINASGKTLDIQKVISKKQEHLTEVDILTNLGPIRPINSELISFLDNKKVVIPYMCEAWEFRSSDVDIYECYKNNIPVMGTNEDHPLVDCFDSVGLIAIKMLLESGLEIRKNRIMIYSKDKFGEVIQKFLRKLEADVVLIKNHNEIYDHVLLEKADALIIADYNTNQEIVSEHGLLDLEKIQQKNSRLLIVPFAGYFDLNYAKKFNFNIYPSESLEGFRMCRTLAYIGYQPIVKLISGGLKVGQIMRDLRECNNNVFELICAAERIDDFQGLAQRITL